MGQAAAPSTLAITGRQLYSDPVRCAYARSLTLPAGGTRGTYKRARGLWEEYLEVSLSDLEAADEKLSHFLTAFKEAHSELEGGEAMDRMFGDCTDILLSLLAMFDVDAAAAQEASVKGLLNKAIEVAAAIVDAAVLLAPSLTHFCDTGPTWEWVSAN